MRLTTIPRLELCAAVVLSTLMKFVVETYKERICITQTIAFTDSEVVLRWLNTAFLKDIFVGNRVAQIKENIPETEWRYVEGSSNPADCLSRGLTPRQLVTHSIWKSGPAWTKLPKNEWPTNKWSNLRISMPSEVLIVSNQVGTHPLLEMVERVSSWQKILRITVWVLRFLKIIETKRYISANDYRKAESVLVKLLQLKSFGKEISSEHFSPKLRKLRPFIKNGLLRVGGRLKNSGLPYAQAHPVVLPSKETLTERIVDFYHQIYLHTGSCLLEAILRQKFWILGARSLIRRRIFKCNRYLSEFRHVQRGATWRGSRHFCKGRPVTEKELPPCYEGENWGGVELDEFIACKSNLAANRQTRMLADLELIGKQSFEIFQNS
nr:unnamed protein product [Callosobruchus analis]